MSLVDRILNRQPDPRKAEVKIQAASLQVKLEDLTKDALGHVIIELDSQQSERIMPGAEGVEPFKMDIVLLAEIFFQYIFLEKIRILFLFCLEISPALQVLLRKIDLPGTIMRDLLSW